MFGANEDMSDVDEDEFGKRDGADEDEFGKRDGVDEDEFGKRDGVDEDELEKEGEDGMIWYTGRSYTTDEG